MTNGVLGSAPGHVGDRAVPLGRARRARRAAAAKGGPLRAAWLRFKQTDLVPIKGSSA